ncbi:Clavaminate synthase-like protein [Aspergillus caelatus]|uniref:Clavaminate synthase-like protein n=1 Tax=Aspergillus caelatus TaxID=61420 RepID=A0A5N6ZTY5_9EURO|nr:Clavaminate synthase-like protein [Aspergillus caelatus]KAE8359710.1 Clavaminate synthase-like protein [Aspergillus caelatus]
MPGISSVPTIDLSQLDDPESKRQALATLEQACTDWGAFYISGAPIGEDELQNATRETKAFFEQPTEKKMEIALENVPSFLGYVPLASERTGDKVDYRERIIVRPDDPRPSQDPIYRNLQGQTQWPAQMPGFRAAHEQVIKGFTKVASTVRALLAEFLGIDPAVLDGMFREEACQNRNVIIRYPEVPKDQGKQESLQGLHGHKDMTFGAIIYQATDHESLQIQSPTGQWVTCPPKPGSLLYVIGAIGESITRGVCKAGFHRVLSTEPGSGPRYSFVTALHMDYDISLANPKIKKTLETIGQDIYRKHGVSNQMLEDFLYEEFDTIGMRILARYMRSLPHVTARFYPEYSNRVSAA